MKQLCARSKLSIKAQKVHNSSVVNYMSALSNYPVEQPQKPKERHMQTEGPRYPDFDLPKDERQVAIGDIGWGISKPGLVVPSNALQ